MWNAIALISSGLTLVAFLAATIAYVYSQKIRERERLIRTAPEEKRTVLVENALEFFHVDTTTLSRKQAFDVALEQVRVRHRRFFITAIVVCFLALIFGAVALAAIMVNKPNDAAPANGTTSISDITKTILLSGDNYGMAELGMDQLKGLYLSDPPQYKSLVSNSLVSIITTYKPNMEFDIRKRWIRSNALDMLREIADYSLDSYFRPSDFKGMDIVGFDFSGAILNNMRFDGAFAINANFSNAHLFGSTFRGTYLRDATFEGADLEGVQFAGSDWFNAFGIANQFENLEAWQVGPCPNSIGEFIEEHDKRYFAVPWDDVNAELKRRLNNHWHYLLAPGGVCDALLGTQSQR